MALVTRVADLRNRAFAAVYDPLMKSAERGELGRLRDQVVGSARGAVLEIGAGTGLNLPRYPAVDRLVATEPEEPMRRRLLGRAGAAPVPVEVIAAPAEALPFDDGEFDTVVSTLVLCSVDDLAAAAREVRRVLKPGGRFLFLEHGGGEGKRAEWQHRLDGVWSAVNAGCHLTRNVTDVLASADLHPEEIRVLEPRHVPPIILPFRLGTAVAGGEGRS
ncbi:MAG: methyltransferase domain-containing protein [Actinobacteria bacterium]|nr:methyltransferase domain-containing protein [Actinomycetota bacterium]